MTRINLLPWRAQRRWQRQRQFLAALGLSILAAVLVSALIGYHYSDQIAGQNERNRFLRQKIAAVQQQVDQIKVLDENKAMLRKRQQMIEALQADHAQMVRLFDALARTIPDGVVLTSIKQESDKKLILEGRSQSNAQVSGYLRALADVGWMNRPELSVIEAQQGDSELPFGFRLSVVLTDANAANHDPEQSRSAGAGRSVVATETGRGL